MGLTPFINALGVATFVLAVTTTGIQVSGKGAAESAFSRAENVTRPALWLRI